MNRIVLIILCTFILLLAACERGDPVETIPPPGQASEPWRCAGTLVYDWRQCCNLGPTPRPGCQVHGDYLSGTTPTGVEPNDTPPEPAPEPPIPSPDEVPDDVPFHCVAAVPKLPNGAPCSDNFYGPVNPRICGLWRADCCTHEGVCG